MHTPIEDLPFEPVKPTFRSELMADCTDSAAKLGRKLLSRELVELACAVHERMKSDISPTPVKKKQRVELADEDWICSLENDPTYSGLDVRREIGKCQAWANLRPGVLVTRRRVTAWLNKAEQPIGYNGTGQSSNAPRIKAIGVPEPSGWQLWLAENRPECVYTDGRSWDSIDSIGQRYIVAQMKQ